MSHKADMPTLTASEMRDAKLNGVATLEKEFISPSQTSAPIVHASSRPTIELKGGVTWARLTALAEKGAEFLEITYAPGAMSGANSVASRRAASLVSFWRASY